MQQSILLSEDVVKVEMCSRLPERNFKQINKTKKTGFVLVVITYSNSVWVDTVQASVRHLLHASVLVFLQWTVAAKWG